VISDWCIDAGERWWKMKWWKLERIRGIRLIICSGFISDKFRNDESE
jgi:hypothetical protein